MRLRTRVLLLIVLLLSMPLSAVAQDETEQTQDPIAQLEAQGAPAPGDFSVAATMLREWGNRGVLFPGDDNASNGVACNHVTGNSTGSVDVVVRGPAVGSFYSGGQWVGWIARVYQVNPDGSLTLLLTSDEFQAFVPYQNIPTKFSDIYFPGLPQGPVYVVAVEVGWYWYGSLDGYRNYGMDVYLDIVNGRAGSRYDACYSVFPAGSALHSTRGTVNSSVTLTGAFFPIGYPATVIWGSKSLGSLTTSGSGTFSVRVKVPATPMGTYPIYVNAGGDYNTIAGYYTVVPRIKVIEGTVARGQTVNISLRGFAKKELVRIRWRNPSGSWVEVARVTTSNSGSANVYVTVPSWAPDGPGSVRGDGPNGRAQTNVVYVTGGTPFTLASAESPTATPTASPTETTTVTPSPTIDLGTPIATMTETATVTETPVVPTETPTETVTPTETSEVSPTELATGSPPEDASTHSDS